MIAAVCGDCVVWKPSSKTPLTAIAVQKICNRVFERHGLRGVFNLVIGEGRTVGERMIEDRRVPLVSFTGSPRWAGTWPKMVARRLGRTHSRTGRQQRHHGDGRCESRPGPARRGVRRRGHGGPALHHHAAAVPATRDCARMTEALVAAYKQVQIGNPMDEHGDGAADHRACGRRYDARPRKHPAAGRRDSLRRPARTGRLFCRAGAGARQAATCRSSTTKSSRRSCT